MDALLEIKGLRVAFESTSGSVAAASHVDLRVKRGEAVGLVGESGCGKTVTALATMGLIPPRGSVSGEIVFDGENLLSKTPGEMRSLRGDRIAMIFQDPMTALNPLMTVGRQLCEPLLLHRGATGAEAAARAVEMLDLVRVPNAESRLGQYPHQLSGGLAQRVMIAMALVCRPEMLIADEPTTALDVTIQAQILALLGYLRAQTGSSVLMITHDLAVVAEFCDRVYVMYAGHIVESADVFELFGNPLHPYTAGLLRSMPRLDAYFKRGELYSIPGMVPDLRSLPQGCPFEPRCGVSLNKCAVEAPALVEREKSHAVRCWRAIP